MNWWNYCNSNPVTFTDPMGLKDVYSESVFKDPNKTDSNYKTFKEAVESIKLLSPTDKNKMIEIYNETMTHKFSELMRECVGAEYSHDRPPSELKADCSGLFVTVIDKMGFKVSKNLTANQMASGNCKGIIIDNNVNNAQQGDEGKLNFYYFGEDYISHVNYGVGQIEGENEKQIVDASSADTTWQEGRNKNQNQQPKALPNKVNKTWTPFSTNTIPDKQANLDFSEMERK